ncbi:MAG: HEAT repeat domain-containing protein, partial [Candidatus Acidiferrales bacterium]
MAMVLVPFLFWRGTWFGRKLGEEETGRYLSDSEHPRRVQHALVQIGERIVAADAGVKRWYPEVMRLASHPQLEIRSTAAWVMGQDNQSQEFHAALLGLLQDAEPLVRHNAALGLVRFGDDSGRPELRAMLLPYSLTASADGVLSPRLQAGDPVNPGTLMGRIETGAEAALEIRSPLPGEIREWLASNGARVKAGEPLLLLSPSEDQLWEALRAFYLVGQAEDLPAVEAFAHALPELSERIRQ